MRPLPRVIPTASKAESAISITLPAARFTIVLPLNKELVPTDRSLEMVALGTSVPLTLTAKVMVVATAADRVVL